MNHQKYSNQESVVQMAIHNYLMMPGSLPQHQMQVRAEENHTSSKQGKVLRMVIHNYLMMIGSPNQN